MKDAFCSAQLKKTESLKVSKRLKDKGFSPLSGTADKLKLLCKGLAFFVLLLSALPLRADEGMWLPHLLKQLNEKDMQALGMQLTAEDIYSLNSGSLKDAIVSFGGFCTGSVISSQGLLLTNHHCGYSAIQSHSSLEHNYLEDGFWAGSPVEELPNPGLTATFLVRMEEVTQEVIRGFKAGMTAAERQSIIDQNIARLLKETPHEAHEEVQIKPFFKGLQYYLLVTVTYPDVRLVGTPPESIGKFGADTDNWEWPRHTGDFSLFRIYAGPDNLPAEYSPDNRPYQAKKHLSISLKGIKEGDFTLVFGYPARTNEYLPASGIKHILDVVDPVRVGVRDRSLAIMGAAMRSNSIVKLKYASKFARIANGWKKWIGEMQGLKRSQAMAKRTQFELLFLERLQNNPDWQEAYGDLLPRFKTLYADLAPYERSKQYYSEFTGRNVELLSYAGLFRRLLKIYRKSGEEGFVKFKERLRPYLEKQYKNYLAEIDREIFTDLMAVYLSEVPEEHLPKGIKGEWPREHMEELSKKLYENSSFSNWSAVEKLLTLKPEELEQKVGSDPAYLLFSRLAEAYEKQVQPEYQRLKEEIEELERSYLRGLITVFPKRKFYPDANGTLRVSYGQVRGYQPRDAVVYLSQTYLKGVMEKYKPGDYEFDVPEKLRELYRRKQYGHYGEGSRMPVCFLGTNHTTGGNSGSPVLNARGHLIGLNFDRVWEGTMSDVYYDPAICRNIMVDIRYVLFIIDQFAGASHLIKEMDIAVN